VGIHLKLHYYSKLNQGGQTVRLHAKVTINPTLIEAVGPPASFNVSTEAVGIRQRPRLIRINWGGHPNAAASVNQLTEVGALSRPPPLNY
jgi:hypothetical protein